ncbi:MAG: ATP-dependent helicase [Clostridia bacterium]|nr:ATP-dependent helicase [Clostridia bacterium]
MSEAEELFESFKTEYGFPLDPEQSEACKTVDGKVLLLAVPGSGKTTVMIARLGYMTRVCGISPRSILAITYSVAGTKEMQKRYQKAFGACDIEFRTINGFCATMINRYEKVKGRKAFELIEKDESVSSILRTVMAEQGIFPTENDLREVKTAITYCKNSMLSDEEIEKTVKLEGKNFSDIYRAYEAYKRERRLMDYDDQLVYGYTILKNHPEVNAVYADRFKYVCVDEAQDTSKLQHDIIKLLTDRSGNVFMVGDEDQSIYGFRAAYPKALLDFKATYPDAKILTISNNYRSTKSIVKAADSFIKQNKERIKDDKSMKTGNPDGVDPVRIKLTDLRLLPDYVRRVYAEKTPGTTACLFRLNESMLPIIDLLSEKEVPFRVRGGDGLFFTSATVTDVINILNFASDPYDGELWKKIYYKLPLGITKQETERAIAYNYGDDMLPIPDFLSTAVFLNDKKRARAKRVWEDIRRISEQDTYEAIRTIFFSLGYNNKRSDKVSEITKRNTLLALAYRHRNRGDFYRRLTELEGEVKRGSVSQDGIILSTIHSAKGLEFDRVLLCDCKNGVLPMTKYRSNLRDEEKAEREEDRRLFYVGMTRAKSVLEIVTWESEFGSLNSGFEFPDDVFEPKKVSKTAQNGILTRRKVSKNSTFLTENEQIFLDSLTHVGASFKHKTFGEGKIIYLNGTFAEIKFDRYPVSKTIDLKTCVMNKLITPKGR